jgi:hypothetical protein
VSSLRPVRVLVASGVNRIRIRADGSLSVVGDKSLSYIMDGASDWLVVSPGASRGIRVGGEPWPVLKVKVAAAPSNIIAMSADQDGWLPGVRYAGELHVVVRENGRLDVVNHVDVETYVGCVVAGEVWPTFHTEAYRAQAIVSRTFVLYQMKQRQGASFDVTATTERIDCFAPTTAPRAAGCRSRRPSSVRRTTFRH